MDEFRHRLLETHVWLRPRVDQPAFSSDESDYSDIVTALSCYDSILYEQPADKGAPNVRSIDGRLFSIDNPIYLLPLDGDEFERLDKQDFLLKLSMWGLFSLQQDIDDTLATQDPALERKAVLDIGCGSGQWALNIASSYPHVRVVGIDQVPQMPEDLPSNVEFQQHDVNDGLSAFYGTFDLVHVRCIGSGTKSYRTLIKEATKCLNPGGLAIFIEGDFDLVKEDQRTIQEPADDEHPNGSLLQKWMQAVGTAQDRRCRFVDVEDSPHTLDKGLWQFGSYDPFTCWTASMFTPVTPWPQSDLNEETLHFKVAGTLMRQNLKLFLTGTEQLLIEDGRTKEEVAEWAARIREEIDGEGLLKMWFRWRVAWGRVPRLPSNEISASNTSAPQTLPSERRMIARENLVSKIHHFKLRQCHIRNQRESLDYVKQRNHQPFSTRVILLDVPSF